MAKRVRKRYGTAPAFDSGRDALNSPNFGATAGAAALTINGDVVTINSDEVTINGI